MAKTGRPPLYETPEQMQKAIDEYFEWCDNRSRKVYNNKTQEEYQISDPAPYTMSGLARRLGMSRQALIDYKNKGAFLDTIKKARSKVEEDVELRMNQKDTFTPGLIFNAKNNFNWRDKTETDVTSGGEKLEGLVMYRPKKNEPDMETISKTRKGTSK